MVCRATSYAGEDQGIWKILADADARGARKAEAKANKARHLAVQRVPVKRTLWKNPVLFALKPGFMSSFGLGQALTKVIGPF